MEKSKILFDLNQIVAPLGPFWVFWGNEKKKKINKYVFKYTQHCTGSSWRNGQAALISKPRRIVACHGLAPLGWTGGLPS